MQQPQCGKFVKNLQRFRLITFDITDTLLRFRHPVGEQYKLTAEREFGITGLDVQAMNAAFRNEFKTLARVHPNYGAATQMPWQQWWLQLVQSVFASVRPDMAAAQRTALAETLLRQYRTSDCWCEIASGRALIERLRASGKHVGVISNFDESLSIVLQEMNYAELFDFVVTSYAARVQKPERGIFEQALRVHNMRSDEALHIGNSYALDYVGARNAGWASVLLTHNSVHNNSSAATPQSMPPAAAADATASGAAVQAYTNLTELLTALETQDIKWI